MKISQIIEMDIFKQKTVLKRNNYKKKVQKNDHFLFCLIKKEIM